MSRRPRVLVVQHQDDCPVGLVHGWLEAAGLDVDVLRAHEGGAVPATAGDGAGLIVLGGRMGATDDAEHHWLAPTRSLIAATHAQDTPYLGICLGHQLTAVALGGSVTPSPRGRALGLPPWSPTPEGRLDPLTSALAPGSPVLHYNNDVVSEPPPGATVLARTSDGDVQALRFGTRGWGVQFHPEVTSGIVAGWSEGTEAEERLVAELRDRQARLTRAWEPLFRRFADIALSAWADRGR